MASLATVGCDFQERERIISIVLPPAPNQHGQYVCATEKGPTEELVLDCKSGSEKSAAAQIVNLSQQAKACAGGAARLWLVLSSEGSVMRVQYQCGTADVGEFPEE